MEKDITVIDFEEFLEEATSEKIRMNTLMADEGYIDTSWDTVYGEAFYKALLEVNHGYRDGFSFTPIPTMIRYWKILEKIISRSGQFTFSDADEYRISKHYGLCGDWILRYDDNCIPCPVAYINGDKTNADRCCSRILQSMRRVSGKNREVFTKGMVQVLLTLDHFGVDYLCEDNVDTILAQTIIDMIR